MITPESNAQANAIIKADLDSWHKRPHLYVMTDPYTGCEVCGYGPGAYFHNEHYVRRWEAAPADAKPTM